MNLFNWKKGRTLVPTSQLDKFNKFVADNKQHFTPEMRLQCSIDFPKFGPLFVWKPNRAKDNRNKAEALKAIVDGHLASYTPDYTSYAPSAPIKQKWYVGNKLSIRNTIIESIAQCKVNKDESSKRR